MTPTSTAPAWAYNTFFDGVDETIYSQEFNIISPDRGPFTWILGAYYQNDTYDFPHRVTSSSVSRRGWPSTRCTASNPEHTVAGFGQASPASCTDGVEIQGGSPLHDREHDQSRATSTSSGRC